MNEHKHSKDDKNTKTLRSKVTRKQPSQVCYRAAQSEVKAIFFYNHLLLICTIIPNKPKQEEQNRNQARPDLNQRKKTKRALQ